MHKAFVTTLIPVFILTIVFAFVLPGLAAFAQEERPEKQDNIGHTHHLHRHNPPHPAGPDASRFTTSRKGAVLPLPGEEDAFFFVIFGDRTGGPATGVSVLADAVRDVNLLEPDFVITVGDLVEGYNKTDRWLTQMKEYKSIMSKLLCPWFPVPGNHDIYWRGAGAKPAGEHEADYEQHFGPLWYAFRHKNSWFIALYSDEGNLETGEKNFRKPECQKMSPEQFKWLGSTLKKAKDADHIFLFLHHPRWLKGNYGDDWEKVHKLLAEAGNVTAVFAGHIHYMRYDGSRDGIEYVTLATTGAHQNGAIPEAGMLHHFHIITVRKNQVAMAALPVGEVMDVREITYDLLVDAGTLTMLRPSIAKSIELGSDGSAHEMVPVKITNPVRRPIEVMLMPKSHDSRWIFSPDHTHTTIEPGKEFEFKFLVQRAKASMDQAIQVPELALQIDYLAKGFRYTIPERQIELPVNLSWPQLKEAAPSQALFFDGKKDHLRIESGRFELPDGPLTLECWFQAHSFAERTGLVTKTENSDYGIFVSRGKPGFYVFVGNTYMRAEAPDSILETGRLHHIAGVFDGKEGRLYVDGQCVASAKAGGARRTNSLPLLVGADVTGDGGATSHFHGLIDSVRISSTSRYGGKQVEPERRFDPDAHTVLLLEMEGIQGKWTRDHSKSAAHATVMGSPKVEPVSCSKETHPSPTEE